MNLNVYKPFTFVLRFTMPASTDRLTFLDVFAGDTPQALLAYESSDQPQYIVWALYGEVWSPLVYEYSFDPGQTYLLACYYDGETCGVSVNAGGWVSCNAPPTLYDSDLMRLRAVFNQSNLPALSCSLFDIYPYVLSQTELTSL